MHALVDTGAPIILLLFVCSPDLFAARSDPRERFVFLDIVYVITGMSKPTWAALVFQLATKLDETDAIVRDMRKTFRAMDAHGTSRMRKSSNDARSRLVDSLDTWASADHLLDMILVDNERIRHNVDALAAKTLSASDTVATTGRRRPTTAAAGRPDSEVRRPVQEKHDLIPPTSTTTRVRRRMKSLTAASSTPSNTDGGTRKKSLDK